jgi:hypothetical protein
MTNKWDLDDRADTIRNFIENNAFDVVCEECGGKHDYMLSVPSWGEYYHKSCLEIRLERDYKDIFWD